MKSYAAPIYSQFIAILIQMFLYDFFRVLRRLTLASGDNHWINMEMCGKQNYLKEEKINIRLNL
jgi:hypothetical protein